MKCLKCGYLRQPNDDAPAWQCPACHVAYAKVALAASAVDDADHDELCVLAASGQRILIACIVLNLVLRAVAQSKAMPPLLLDVLGVALSIYAVLGTVRLCTAFQQSFNRKIVYMVLSFVPLVNVVLYIVLSIRATRMLRAAGWKVGLFGARS
jgi:hypothetical protein